MYVRLYVRPFSSLHSSFSCVYRDLCQLMLWTEEITELEGEEKKNNGWAQKGRAIRDSCRLLRLIGLASHFVAASKSGKIIFRIYWFHVLPVHIRADSLWLPYCYTRTRQRVDPSQSSILSINSAFRDILSTANCENPRSNVYFCSHSYY